MSDLIWKYWWFLKFNLINQINKINQVKLAHHRTVLGLVYFLMIGAIGLRWQLISMTSLEITGLLIGHLPSPCDLTQKLLWLQEKEFSPPCLSVTGRWRSNQQHAALVSRSRPPAFSLLPHLSSPGPWWPLPRGVLLWGDLSQVDNLRFEFRCPSSTRHSFSCIYWKKTTLLYASALNI